MQADQLAKRLHLSIPGRIPPATRRRFGCFNFVNHGYPDTTDPVRMALAWFQHVALDASRGFRKCGWAVEACIGFLDEQTGAAPSANDLLSLKALLSRSPVVPMDLARWFNRVYPQERGRSA